MSRTIRRLTAILLATLLLMAMVTGCAQAQPATGIKDDAAKADTGTAPKADDATKSTIRFMIWDSPQKDAYLKSYEEFKKINPNIEVTFEVNGWNEYWQKIQTEMAGGTCADVFWNQIQYLPSFITADTLLDLKPYIEKSNMDLSVFDSNLIKIFQKDGKIYSIVKDWDTIGLYYNKDLFDKMKMPYPNDLTWNPEDGGTFLELARKLTLDKNGKNAGEGGFDKDNITQYGFLSTNSNQPFYWNFILMNGGKIQNEQWGDQFFFDQPETVGAMQFCADLIHKYHVSPTSKQMDSGSGGSTAETLFFSGKIAMKTDGSWATRYLFENAQFKLGISQLPKGPKGVISIANGIGESIYKGSKNVDAAWKWVEFCAGEKNQSIFAETGTVFPSRVDLIPKFVAKWAKDGLDVQPLVDEFKGNIALSPEAMNWNEINAVVDKNYSLLFLGEIDAKKAGDDIMAGIKKIQSEK